MNDLLDDSPKFNRNGKQLFNGNEIQRVDFGMRLAAYVLDFLFMSILGFILSLIITAIGVNTIAETDNANNAAATFGGLLLFFIGLFWILLIGTLLYNFIEAFTGASLGKIALGIKIGTQDGQTASIGTYFLRALIKNFQYILLVLGVYTLNETVMTLYSFYGLFFFVSCLFAIGSDRLALHDKMVGTAVYKKTDLDK